MSPARVVAWLVLGTAVLRVALAAGTGLGIDESYMVAAGRTLQLSYFDHPPLSWWLSRLAALAVGSEAPLAVRLPFIALFAGSTWLMFALTRRLFEDRAGMWAAVGLNLSPVFSLTSGTWVLPDGPLIFSLLGAGYFLVLGLEARPSPQPSPAQARGRGRGGTVIARNAPSPALAGEGWGEGATSPWLSWPLSGVFVGLALLSKYSAVLVLAGAVVYLLTQPEHRRWFRRPHPYVAALIAAACCAPILIWNIQHDFASLAFQGGRAASAKFQPLGPLATLGGEALFVGPWIWLPMMLAWVSALRAGPGSWRTWLPTCLGVGPVILFVVVSFWARHVLFHWAAPGYLMLFPLLGAWAAGLSSGWLMRGNRAAAGLLVAGGVVLLAEARVNLLAPFGVDPGFQATDWTPLRDQLAARGLLHRPNTVLAATNWADAGKLDYGLGGEVPVVVLNPDARQYLFLPPRPEGRDVLVIGPRISAERLRGMFAEVATLGPLRLRGVDVQMFLGEGLSRDR